MKLPRVNQDVLRGLVTLALMALILFWIGPASIWEAIQHSRSGFIFLGLLFTPLIIGIKTLRWQILVQIQDSISFKEALRSYLAGLTLATITPLAAGEIGRGLFVESDDRAGLTGKVALDKLVDLSTVGVFSGVGLLLIGETNAYAVGLGVLVSLGAAWAGGYMLLPTFQRRFGDVKGGWLVRLRIPSIINGLVGIPRLQLGLNIGLSFMGFVIFYAQAFILLLAFWPEASWQVVPYFPIITLSTILPVAIGGLGIREWTAVLLLRQFGVPEAAAFSAFFLHFLVVQLLPALFGAIIIGSFMGKRK